MMKHMKSHGRTASCPLEALAHKLSFRTNDSPHRIVTFIAAQALEGTTTIARNYARHMGQSNNLKAITLDHRFFTPQGAQSQWEKSLPPGLHEWACKRNHFNQSLMHDDSLWGFLRETYDLTLLDAPALQRSTDGLTLAAKSDATVLVVAAESTRQPVIEHLRDSLIHAGANIVGVVMNKRRHYVPEKAYARL